MLATFVLNFIFVPCFKQYPRGRERVSVRHHNQLEARQADTSQKPRHASGSTKEHISAAIQKQFKQQQTLLGQFRPCGSVRAVHHGIVVLLRLSLFNLDAAVRVRLERFLSKRNQPTKRHQHHFAYHMPSIRVEPTILLRVLAKLVDLDRPVPVLVHPLCYNDCLHRFDHLQAV
jgi:hypothetical protein